MAAQPKSKEAIEKMRISGKLAAQVLEMISPFVLPGVTTEELNQRCHDFIVQEQKGIPAPLNYKGYPKSICTSVNHVVCHGIPANKPLKKGDILNLDVTVLKDGFHGDTSKMFLVGDFSEAEQKKPQYRARKRLIEVTYDAMWAGIKEVKPNASLRKIAQAIQSVAENAGYSVVRDFCGHGIGEAFHEDPQVLHYDGYTQDIFLEEGMTFTIEPMINSGHFAVKVLGDGWTAVTRDRKDSAQWEHTILVTHSGYDVLTLREEEATYLASQHA